MKSSRVGNVGQAIAIAGLVLLGLSPGLRADDTEIYQTTYDSTTAGRPKVLIVIDDSGSMDTNVPGQRPKYNPSASYANVHDSDRIYWSTNGSPPSRNGSNYFYANTNRCAESTDGLDNEGFFQTKARRWRDSTSTESCTTSCPSAYPYLRRGGRECHSQNNNRSSWVSPIQECETIEVPGYWDALNSSDHSPRHVECQFDVTNSNPSNLSGVANGYAKDNVTNANALSAATPAESNVNWGNESYTFYSAHYMDYWYDTSLIVDRTRMEIAQDVITSLITANTGIDFGLLEFNGNWSAAPASNGGRIVHRIVKNMTALQRKNVVDMVKYMTASGSTPLCEATYEASRYLAGKTLVYGATDDGTRNGDLLPRDLLAESPLGTYASPASDCAYTYIVLMTDGLPQNDTDANAAIESLTGETCDNYASDGQGSTKNCLPVLTKYMANTDLDNDTTNGNQFGITYTIGFTTNQTLLSDAAANGKGQYYTANNADELAEAFRGAILSILSTDTTFTSPAVAVDTFSRTQSRDDVFYAMFKPEERIDWRGNIKKLKIAISNDSAILVDANGNAAIDSSTGFIKDTATTFWSTSADGPSVEEGGVGGLLAARDPDTRDIYSNTGTDNALEVFNSDNITYDAFGFDDDSELFTFFGVSSQSNLDTLLAWARGFDVYDEDGDEVTSETRPWILADILHSQPMVVNYGARGSFTQLEPDLRIVVGTNAGFVHMFSNDDGQEDWAFFPKELAPVLRQRAINPLSSQHVYGVDNTPVLYTEDIAGDGTIDGSDSAYVYLTLRRGGDLIYALDISDPDNPEFMWYIEAGNAGFGELGQTWSRPVVTRIPGYKDNSGKPIPVLVFGAGYDTNKDGTGLATADSQGRGLYIVDATTGALVWSVTPQSNSTTNLQETGLVHSVAAGIMPLDSNGDELTDRLYFGDTGGNVWRVDLPGSTRPTSSQDTWRIVKLAGLNGGSTSTDRRFFNSPDIVRTSYAGKAFDAVAIGSGDRTNPNSTDVDDQFYMIRDEQVQPYFTEFDQSADCDSDPETVDDFRCQLPLGVGDLYDVTDNAIQDGENETTRSAAVAALGAANGWRMDLTASGEKSLAKSLTIDGKIYFTTFSPESDSLELCVPSPGTGRLYIVGLTDATEVKDFNNDNNTERSWIIGSLIPDTPSPHFGSDGEIRLLLPPGSGGGTISNPFLTGATLPDPYGSYWYREEY